MPIALPGLSTGIDTGAIIQQLVSIARNPIISLQDRQQKVRDKADAFDTFQSRLTSLQNAADALRHAVELRTYKTTTSDESAATVEASSGASEGSHEIIVHQLAAAQRMINTGVDSLETALGAGTFAYTYDATTRVLQTTADTTLEDLRDLINNDGGNPGVTASILEYDAGGGHVQHLVLGGNDTGAAHAITIDDAQTTLDAFKSATFTVTQAAQNSQVRVDGYPSGDWISRSGNTLDDVLAGVTLHLHEGSDTTVRISLTRDTEGLKQKVKDLVSAYNSVKAYAKEKTAYDEATKTGGVLMGEYSITASLHELQLPLVETATGFKDGADAYTLAAQIGLTTDRDGNLVLQEKTDGAKKGLDDALTDNYLGVLALLGADKTGASDSNNLKFYGARETTTAGVYDVKAVFENDTLVSAQIKLASEPESAWRNATVNGNLIVGASGKPEQNLQITGTYTGSGTVTAQVRVRQGVAGRLYDGTDGLIDKTLKLAKNSLQSTDDSLQKQIDNEVKRVASYQERLTAEYARLEQALTLLQAQRGALGMFNTTSTSG